VYLVTAEEMRELDRYTMEEVGLPGMVLMEHAGKAVAEAINHQYPEAKNVVVLCGTGNNGGDGWVLARHLVLRGWHVQPWLIGNDKRLAVDSRTFYQVCQSFVQVESYTPDKRKILSAQLQATDVIVDALIGTGSSGELRATIAEVVQLVNQQHDKIVVAVDLPTGVHADTGEVLTEAVRAHHTVTFGYPKWGHYLRPGADACGEVQVVDIGLAPMPESLKQTVVSINTPDHWKHFLSSRNPWSHKGTCGHLLLIGGAEGMLGAIEMAAQAAYKVGVGVVTCTVPASQKDPLSAKVTQELIWSWPGEGTFSADSVNCWEQAKSSFSAVAIGPGLGRFPGEEEWLGTLLQQIDVPLVLDADALNILADHPKLFSLRNCMVPTILTPHPKEMARLLQITVTEVEQQRPVVAKELAQRTGMIVVLKGRYTMITLPSGKQRINLSGSPALAKAGSGDLLTGLIGSWLAQSTPAAEAVSMAVYLHGKAGEIAAEQTGVFSVTYREVLSAIGTAIYPFISTNVPTKPTYFPENLRRR
jgi:ADP-dependent NAD(P)H-hydrate dehydratase / NAD(P)H-hydrate epimerase